MTEFITRNYGNANFEVIIKTDNKEHYKAAETFARQLIDHLKPGETTTPEPQWIPVTERVPSDDSPVLVTCGRGYRVFIARYDLIWKKWRVSHTLKITHWMPLPSSPKEGAMNGL